MRGLFSALLVTISLVAFSAAAAEHKPISLHPDNPRYLLWRGKPTILISSAEHYGAVLNRAFDFEKYLATMEREEMNQTRVFSGVYREIPSSFGIVDNTLAPSAKDYVCPWPRKADGGLASDGEPKFDLKSWNDDYFKRLKAFMAEASRRGVVVELVLMCTVYDDKLWAINPMNAKNNVPGIGTVGFKEIYTLKDKPLVEVQTAFIRKVVAELREFDNLYYEVCNEPYFGGVSQEWNDHVVATIVEAEKDFPNKHLIAQNISNGSQKIADPNPNVSIFNFHYCAPPDAVAQNYDLKKVIADDETGFRGTADLPYRREAWDFVIAGGAIYSNLDYSFSHKHPDGTFKITSSPGGGGPELRKQLRVLKRFIGGFEFWKMQPANDVVAGGIPDTDPDEKPRVVDGKQQPPPKPTVRVLAEKGKAYAIYVNGGRKTTLELKLPPGDYRGVWLNTKTGKPAGEVNLSHAAQILLVDSPDYRDDIALELRRVDKKK